VEVTSSKTGRRALRLGLALLALALLAGGWYAARYKLQSGGGLVAASSPSDRVAGGSALSSIMQGVTSQTRLWKGDPNAPVTIVEFGDFQ
jgi:hypothetical protein